MSNCLCQFWNEKSIPLQIFHNFSVSLHITSLKIFSSCIFYFGQNDPMKRPIFTLSNVLVKIYQIPCVIFETTKSVFLQILHDSSLSLKITLLAKLCTKGTNHSGNFGELSARIKIHQIFIFFERTNQFFFNFCITLSVSWYITPLYFFSWIFISFQQKEPIKIYTNLVKFHLSSWESEILHFDGLLL